MCCEGSITEHKQAVPHSVRAERSFGPGTTGKSIRRRLQNIDANMCDLKFIY